MKRSWRDGKAKPFVEEVAMESNGPGAIFGPLERLTYGRGKNGRLEARPKNKTSDVDGLQDECEVSSLDLVQKGAEEGVPQIDIRV